MTPQASREFFVMVARARHGTWRDRNRLVAWVDYYATDRALTEVQAVCAMINKSPWQHVKEEWAETVDRYSRWLRASPETTDQAPRRFRRLRRWLGMR